MAWIESHQSLKNHPKTILLSKKLGITKAQVIGHLHMLWWWCADYAADGTLKKYGADQIADAADWEGNAGEFLQYLADTGFIDRDPLRIHDWQSYRLHYDHLLASKERRLKQVRQRVKRWRDRNASGNARTKTELESSDSVPKPDPQSTKLHPEQMRANNDPKKTPVHRHKNASQESNASSNASVTQCNAPTDNTDLTDNTNNITPAARTKTPFRKPTPEEVTDYAKSIGFNLNGHHFCDSNEAKGWRVGKTHTPMKDWRATVRTWKANEDSIKAVPLPSVPGGVRLGPGEDPWATPESER